MTIRSTDIRQLMRGVISRRSITIRGAGRSPRRRPSTFNGGALFGNMSGELGLRKFLEMQGHTLVVTSDKDGPGSDFDR